MEQLTWYEILLRLLMAAAAGSIIGLERQHRHRAAGIKTHALVCLAAAIVSLVQIGIVRTTANLVLEHPELSSALKSDFGRLGAQVISGIGFIGAGTILHNRGIVRGLTTAATLWLVACIGLGVGMGQYLLSAIAVVVSEAVMFSLRFFLDHSRRLNRERQLKIVLFDKKETMPYIRGLCEDRGIRVQSVELLGVNDNLGTVEMHLAKDEHCYTYLYALELPKGSELSELMQTLEYSEKVLSVSDYNQA